MKKQPTLLFILMLLLLPATVFAQAKRIYLACDDHTDYMWTADEKTYRQAFLRMLDYYLDLADQTANNPSDFQSRFVCDGSYWLWVYQHEKSRDDFERLIGRIQSSHITAPMTTLVLLYGAMPMEAALRSLYYAGSLERQYGLRFRLALAMENQTLPWGLASLFAGSGAKYSWKGICDCATRIPDAKDREHEIYYWTGPDGQKILLKWNSLLKDNKGMGGYAEARNPWAIVNYVQFDRSFQSRYPYPIIGCFGKGWDDLETRNDEFVTAAKNLSDSNRRVIVSNEIDFFEDFEAHFGSTLPMENYSYGNEWDLLCASMAELSAGVKRSVETLRAAEGMAAIVSLQRPDFWKDRDERRMEAYVNLGLYYEHSWTADGPIPRNQRRDWQRRIAKEIVGYVNTLQSQAGNAFGQLLSKNNEHPRFYAYNPLGWTRTDYADIAYSSTEPIHVVDIATGQEVPSQAISLHGQSLLRILASEIPAVGYKGFEIRKGVGKAWGTAAQRQDSNFENEFYRLEIAPSGAITHWIDKRQSNREFAKSVEQRWINDIGSSTGTLVIENPGPVSVTVTASSSSPLKRKSSITLFRSLERIEINNEIDQNFSDVKTYGFAFNLQNPDTRHEEIGAIARARLRKDGGDYAERCARYDWLTFNHFVDMTGNDHAGVTLSNADSLFFRLGNSEVKTLDTQTPLLSALIGGQVDGKKLGIEDQGSDQHFQHRFALKTHGSYDPVSAIKFSLEHQNPLIAGWNQGATPVLPETGYSLLRVSNPNVLLWTIKPAEEGIRNGVIIRLWNVSDAEQDAQIQWLPSPIASAQPVSHLETDEGNLETTPKGISVHFQKQQIRTFRLKVPIHP